MIYSSKIHLVFHQTKVINISMRSFMVNITCAPPLPKVCVISTNY